MVLVDGNYSWVPSTAFRRTTARNPRPQLHGGSNFEDHQIWRPLFFEGRESSEKTDLWKCEFLNRLGRKTLSPHRCKDISTEGNTHALADLWRAHCLEGLRKKTAVSDRSCLVSSLLLQSERPAQSKRLFKP